MKFSRQRQLILDVILESDMHPTADYIYSTLKDSNPNLSLGTVYRNLSQLVDNGYIAKVSLPNQPDRFDKTVKPHAHLVCEECGDVHDIDSKYIDEFINSLSIDKGLSVNSYNIVLSGHCDKCKKPRA